MRKLGPVFGALGKVTGLTSRLTRQRFGWAPARAGLTEDLDAGHYFAQRESE